MLRRIIIKSLITRKRHLLVAATAVLLAASLIASLVTLSLGMKTQASRELEAYGANMILLPETMSLPAGAGGLTFGNIVSDGYITEESIRLLEADQIAEVRSYAPYLYTIASYQEQKVVLAGTIFDQLRELSPYWKIEGDWVNDSQDEKGSIIGRKVAQRFNLHPGDRFRLDFGGASRDFSVTGIADVGGSEDNQIFINLKITQLLSGRDGQVDLVQIRASTEKRPLPAIATELEKLLSVKAKVISQIAEAEARVLFKVELLMALITALTLLASGVAVFSTLTTSVLERIKEIGLMKALGARNSRIALIFLAEAWAIGLAGGLLGNILGLGMAQAIAKSVFNSYLSPQVVVIPITVAAALAVATVASLGPVRTALTVEPVITLRGE
ncbi:MAG: FtsX-like permease family protein [Chloroflexi bacterium]|nr:FtsX-like permease family protein [Chloroflexota bacterium]